MIEKGIALEVNTRSCYQFGNVDFYKQLLRLYSEYGGKLISLGSDAHYLKYYRFHFEDALAMISDIGEFDIINLNY